MSLAIHEPVFDPRLAKFKGQVKALRRQLDSLTKDYKQLKTSYEENCSKSLKDSLVSLLKLAECVCKADRTLVFWFEKGTPIRLLLQPLGIDKKTSAIIEHETNTLRKRVSSVAAQFDATSELCKAALADVQKLNRKVNHYSRKRVGAAQNTVTTVLEEYKHKEKSVRCKMAEKQLECDRVSASINDTNAGIERTEVARVRTKSARNGAAICGAMGVGGALILAGTAALCPPAALAAGVAGGLSATAGAGGTISAIALNMEGKNLLALQNQLCNQLSSLQHEIAILQAELPALELEKSRCLAMTSKVKDLESNCGAMRAGAKALSASMLQDRELLSRARIKTEEVASDLRCCEYAETRQEIGNRLLEILQYLRQVAPIGRRQNTKKIRQTRELLGQIQMQGPKVLMIVSTPQG